MDKEKIDKEKVGKLLKEVKKGRFKKARKIFNTLGYDEVILSAIMVSMEVEDGGSEFVKYIEKRIREESRRAKEEKRKADEKTERIKGEIKEKLDIYALKLCNEASRKYPELSKCTIDVRLELKLDY